LLTNIPQKLNSTISSLQTTINSLQSTINQPIYSMTPGQSQGPSPDGSTPGPMYNGIYNIDINTANEKNNATTLTAISQYTSLLNQLSNINVKDTIMNRLNATQRSLLYAIITQHSYNSLDLNLLSDQILTLKTSILPNDQLTLSSVMIIVGLFVPASSAINNI
jgi:hypothetical protein